MLLFTALSIPLLLTCSYCIVFVTLVTFKLYIESSPLPKLPTFDSSCLDDDPLRIVDFHQ